MPSSTSKITIWNIHHRQIFWILSTLIIGILISSTASGIYLIRQLQKENPYLNFDLYQISFHSLSQLRRETLRFQVAWLSYENGLATDQDIALQFDLLESRIEVLKRHHKNVQNIHPDLVDDIQRYYYLWQSIKSNQDKFLNSQFSPAEKVLFKQTLDQMELIINVIVRENSAYGRINYERMRRYREHLVILTVTIYCLLLLILIVSVIWIAKITGDRHQALLSLNVSEQRYRTIVETSEEGIWTLDLEYQITFSNSQLLNILGYRYDYLVGKSAQALCPSAETTKMLCHHLDQVMHTGSGKQDIQLQNADGKTLWFYISSTLIDLRAEQGQNILSMLTNITERKEIEQELTNANQRLSRQVNFDELTQIANRRYFNLYIAKVWRDALISQQEMAIALIDVDFFKKYNDYYGHLEGDVCLFKVAQTISASAQRQTDLAARYGGEEFAILLPNTSLIETMKIIENLQSEIRALQIPHPKSLISDILTLSIGVASGIPQASMTVEMALHLADEALYRAKKQGRDQYVSVSFGSSSL